MMARRSASKCPRHRRRRADFDGTRRRLRCRLPMGSGYLDAICQAGSPFLRATLWTDRPAVLHVVAAGLTGEWRQSAAGKHLGPCLCRCPDEGTGTDAEENRVDNNPGHKSSRSQPSACAISQVISWRSDQPACRVRVLLCTGECRKWPPEASRNRACATGRNENPARNLALL